MSTNPLATDTDRAYALAAGLRALARMVTEHPHLTDVRSLRSTMERLLVSVGHGGDDARAQMLAFARAGLACSATVTEHDNGQYAGVDVTFGSCSAVSLHVYADVDKVHPVTQRLVEQVDEGTRRIVEYVPRSILADLDIAPAAGEMGAVA